MFPSGSSNQPNDPPYNWPIDEVFVDFEQGIYKVNGVDVDINDLLVDWPGALSNGGLNPTAPVYATGALYNSLKNALVSGGELIIDVERCAENDWSGNLITWDLGNNGPYYITFQYNVFQGVILSDRGAIYGNRVTFESPSPNQLYAFMHEGPQVGGRYDFNVLQRCGGLLALKSSEFPHQTWWKAAFNGVSTTQVDDLPYAINANRVGMIYIGLAPDETPANIQIKRIHFKPTTFTLETADTFAPLTALDYNNKRIAIDNFAYDSGGMTSYNFGPYDIADAPASNRLVIAVITFRKNGTMGVATTATTVKFDGVDAECVASNGETEVWQLVVPTGTTIDDVAITFADEREYCMCKLLSIITDNVVPYEAKSNSPAAATATLAGFAVISGGLTIAVGKSTAVNLDWTWGGSETVDPQVIINLDQYVISMATFTAVATSAANDLSVADPTGLSTDTSIMALCWAPVGATINDPYWSSVKLMLGFDGADAATTFTAEESSPHALTFLGNAQLDTADKKFGTASLLLDGAGDYVTTPDSADWDISNQPFTVDVFVKFNSTVTQSIFGQWTSTGSLRSWLVERGSNGNLYFYLSTTGANTVTHMFGNPGFVNGVWYHLRVNFDGTIYRLFVNGNMIASSTTIQTAFNAANVLSIGAKGNGTEPFNGWIDEVRFTKGVARNSGLTRFKPPIASFPRT